MRSGFGGGVLLCSAIATILGGCASSPKDEYRMLPTGENGVGVRFSRGNAAMFSHGPNGSVMLLPIRYNSSSRLYFAVSALNVSGVPINFGTEDVSVYVDDYAPVRVQDFNILRQQARWHAQRELDAAWLNAALDGYLAYAATSERPDRYSQAFRYAEGRYAMSSASIHHALNYSVARMGRNVLQTSTIDPGTAHAGWVYADQLVVPDTDVRRLRIAVNLGGHEHNFSINLASSALEVGVQRNIPAVSRSDFARSAQAPGTYQWSDPQPAPRAAPVVIQ